MLKCFWDVKQTGQFAMSNTVKTVKKSSKKRKRCSSLLTTAKSIVSGTRATFHKVLDSFTGNEIRDVQQCQTDGDELQCLLANEGSQKKK